MSVYCLVLYLGPSVSLVAPSLSRLKTLKLYFFITSRVQSLDYLTWPSIVPKNSHPRGIQADTLAHLTQSPSISRFFRLLRHPVRFFYHPFFPSFVYLFTYGLRNIFLFRIYNPSALSSPFEGKIRSTDG